MVTFLNTRLCRKAAMRGADRLAQLVKSDGTFIYQYFHGEGQLPATDYELHRHFCAASALCRIGLHSAEGAALSRQGQLAITVGLDIFSVPFSDGSACIAYRDEVAISVCGVALFAAGFLDATAAERVKPIAKAIGDFMLNQRTRDGDFIHFRHFPSFDPIPLVGAYSTSQALLGLFYLTKLTGEPSWSNEALRSLITLASIKGRPLPINHWALYCFEAAYISSGDLKWYGYARDYLADLLATPLPPKNTPSNWYACNCEAILTWMRMLKSTNQPEVDRELYKLALQRLKVMLRKLLSFQLKDGGFINEPGTRLVQIDFIQHAIIAFFEFSQMEENN